MGRLRRAGEVREVGGGVLVDDSYNANPEALLQAVDVDGCVRLLCASCCGAW